MDMQVWHMKLVRVELVAQFLVKGHSEALIWRTIHLHRYHGFIRMKTILI
jgi:hypothetical protein